MRTSSNGNIFRVTGPLCGEFTGHRWISPHKGRWRGVLMFSLICDWINGWVNNLEAGDLRRHRAHYDATVMIHDQIHLPEAKRATVCRIRMKRRPQSLQHRVNNDTTAAAPRAIRPIIAIDWDAFHQSAEITHSIRYFHGPHEQPWGPSH